MVQGVNDEKILAKLRVLGYSEFLALKLYENFGGMAVTVAEAQRKRIRRCIRVNTLRTEANSLRRSLEAKGFSLETIDGIPEGFVVKSEPKTPALGSTHEYLFGHYYIQSMVSMVVAKVLDPKPGETVLDLSAGVGGKTTHISQLMKNQGTVVAIEPKRERVFSLRSNISRMGVVNALVLQMDGRSAQNLTMKFDRVLLDAPCSGTGLVSKFPGLKNRLKKDDLDVLTSLQETLLDTAVRLVKAGGVIVYSTCSVIREEGEDIILRELEKGRSKPENLDQDSIVAARNPALPGTLRFHTHTHDTEGFFICKLRKI